MCLCSLLALTLVSRATASPAPPAFPGSSAACAATSAPVEADADPLGALWTVSGGCLQGFCTTVAQCPCSTALTRSCTGGVCVYTFPGGGSGGRICRQSFCTTSSQCTCSDGSFGTCSGGVCHF
jgi:hypothetical protein